MGQFCRGAQRQFHSGERQIPGRTADESSIGQAGDCFSALHVKLAKDTLSGRCLPFDRYLISRLGILPRGRGGTALAARYFGALREAEVRFAALSARSFCSD